MTLRIATVPVLDTGIGREAGYENDADLIEAHNAERAAMSDDVRAVLEKLDERMALAFIEGLS